VCCFPAGKNKFSKVLSIGTLYSKCSRALNFENFLPPCAVFLAGAQSNLSASVPPTPTRMSATLPFNPTGAVPSASAGELLRAAMLPRLASASRVFGCGFGQVLPHIPCTDTDTHRHRHTQTQTHACTLFLFGMCVYPPARETRSASRLRISAQSCSCSLTAQVRCVGVVRWVGRGGGAQSPPCSRTPLAEFFSFFLSLSIVPEASAIIS
jgi:hypothetical protein